MNRFSAIFVRASTRFYCTQTAKKAKSPLAILRQKTGLPIGKCREALTKHNEDLEAAESWLYSEAQKEGWAKVEKLKDRTAHQGLIGMLIKRSSNQNQAIMLEVNRINVQYTHTEAIDRHTVLTTVYCRSFPTMTEH